MQFNPIQWNSTHGQILQYDVVLDYGANLVITYRIGPSIRNVMPEMGSSSILIWSLY